MYQMNNFSIEQAPNGYYYLKYDMGNSYYKGLIDPELFFEAVKANYIEVVKESIEFFGKCSTSDPAIISAFELEDGPNNNFIISFTIKNNFVDFNRIIKIPVEKILKTIQEYIGEQEIKIKNLKSFVTNQETLNLDKDKKISLLETKISDLEAKILNLEKELSYTNNKTNDIVKMVVEQLMTFQSKSFIPNTTSISGSGSNSILNLPNNPNNSNQTQSTKTNIFLPTTLQQNPIQNPGQKSTQTFGSNVFNKVDFNTNSIPSSKRTFNFSANPVQSENLQENKTDANSDNSK